MSEKMTKEEAIDLLDNLVGMVEDNHNSNYDTALQMAIKALEELPKRRTEAKRWKTKAAQIASKKNRWIPVSERLPEDEQLILFSTKTGRVYSGKYYDDDSANQWYSYKDKCRAWNNVVNAWMPLPEPYTEESEEQA